jgi:cytochrome c oxidase subunit 4
MSTATESPVAPTGHDEAHDHPSDLKYIKIAIILAVLTAIEIVFYEADVSPGLLKAIILPIMVVKFAIVAGYFMHLKFDSRIFTTMFVAGVAFAVVVYAVMLAAFRFW